MGHCNQVFDGFDSPSNLNLPWSVTWQKNLNVE